MKLLWFISLFPIALWAADIDQSRDELPFFISDSALANLGSLAIAQQKYDKNGVQAGINDVNGSLNLYVNQPSTAQQAIPIPIPTQDNTPALPPPPPNVGLDQVKDFEINTTTNSVVATLRPSNIDINLGNVEIHFPPHYLYALSTVKLGVDKSDKETVITVHNVHVVGEKGAAAFTLHATPQDTQDTPSLGEISMQWSFDPSKLDIKNVNSDIALQIPGYDSNPDFAQAVDQGIKNNFTQNKDYYLSKAASGLDDYSKKTLSPMIEKVVNQALKTGSQKMMEAQVSTAIRSVSAINTNGMEGLMGIVAADLGCTGAVAVPPLVTKHDIATRICGPMLSDIVSKAIAGRSFKTKYGTFTLKGDASISVVGSELSVTGDADFQPTTVEKLAADGVVSAISPKLGLLVGLPLEFKRGHPMVRPTLKIHPILDSNGNLSFQVVQLTSADISWDSGKKGVPSRYKLISKPHDLTKRHLVYPKTPLAIKELLKKLVTPKPKTTSTPEVPVPPYEGITGANTVSNVTSPKAAPAVSPVLVAPADDPNLALEYKAIDSMKNISITPQGNCLQIEADIQTRK